MKRSPSGKKARIRVERVRENRENRHQPRKQARMTNLIFKKQVLAKRHLERIRRINQILKVKKTVKSARRKRNKKNVGRNTS